jgi:hypothetical protein
MQAWSTSAWHSVHSEYYEPSSRLSWLLQHHYVLRALVFTSLRSYLAHQVNDSSNKCDICLKQLDT